MTGIVFVFGFISLFDKFEYAYNLPLYGSSPLTHFLRYTKSDPVIKSVSTELKDYFLEKN